MTTSHPDRVRVRSTDGVVQVEGLTQEQVEFALDLARGVMDELVHARSALSAQVEIGTAPASSPTTACW